MNIEINENTPIAALSVGQFFNLMGQHLPARAGIPEEIQTADFSKGYVYGLKGIRQLFGVSHATAQHYKDTFLKPAVRQRGRKIVIDVVKAMELFDEYSRK